MKIVLLAFGKTRSGFVGDGIPEYLKRLKHYCRFEMIEATSGAAEKIAERNARLDAEAKVLSKHLRPSDFVVLLDENGKQLSSVEFANWLQKKQVAVASRLVFVIGGAFGFAASFREAAQERISLSPMTFPHQLVRLVFLEQLYRAFTILSNEPYHHP
jgi:23S rRNA (pseudouridine1915-N3)-methyltransferase